MSDFFEQPISSKRIYQGKILNLRVDTVKLPNGHEATREVVEHSGAVAIVALTERDEVILVRQYRHAVGKVMLEIPAGKLEPGEQPQECAHRELSEETGCHTTDLQLLFRFFSTPGFANEEMYLYLAKGLTCHNQHPDDDETIEIMHLPLKEAIEMIKTGEICDAKTIIGILAINIQPL